jgi:hypothetical protein
MPLPDAFAKSGGRRFVAGRAIALAILFTGLALGNSCGPESFHQGSSNDAGAGGGGGNHPGAGGASGIGGAGELGGSSGENGQDASVDAPRDLPQDIPQDTATADTGIDTGASDAPPSACLGTIQDKITPCNGEPPCTKGCGLNLASIGIGRASKLCTCPGAGQTWQCPNLGVCSYPPITLTCFNLPTPLPLCPVTQVEVGSNLIVPNATACTLAPGETCGQVCGSVSGNSYQDSGGNGKMGYCVCVTKGATAVWQCASVNEWPPEVTPPDGG